MSLWDDVVHDEVTTRRAIERLEAAADRLSALTRSREDLADEARLGWQGVAREGFDRRLAALITQSEELIHQFRVAAATIESDLEAAVLEQRRREQRRAEIEDHTASLVGSG